MDNTTKDRPMPIIRYRLRGKDKEFRLSCAYEKVLQKLFVGTTQVNVKKLFNNGQGGCYVLEVLPFVGEKDDLAEQLPAVVKLGPVETVRREADAYGNHIENFLPLSIPITHKEISDNCPFGGLRYHLAGQGVFDFQNLLEYCSDDDNGISDLEALFNNQLLKALGKLHSNKLRYGAIEMRSSYDRILYVNLVLDCGARIDTKNVLKLTPEDIRKNVLERNQPLNISKSDWICLHNFIVTEIDTEGQSITLNLAQQGPLDNPQDSFRIRVNSVDNVDELSLGQTIEALYGRVDDTRMSLLHKALKVVVDEGNTIRLDDGTELPNPIFMIEDLLNSTLSPAAICKIHGDANLNNALVCLDNKMLNFVDFSLSRIDSVLHDYLRLEAEVITKIIPTAIANHGKPDLVLLHSLYMNLHIVCIGEAHGLIYDRLKPFELKRAFHLLKAIRLAAQKYFADPNDKNKNLQDYYKSLLIYLMGTLKFSNLDRTAKQCAAIGAATLGYHINELEKIKVPISEERGLLSKYCRPPQEMWTYLEDFVADKRCEQDKWLGRIVASIPINTQAKIKVLSKSSQPRYIIVEAVNPEQIKITSWDNDVKVLLLQDIWPEDKNSWPDGHNHFWKAQPIDPNHEFHYEDGSIKEFTHPNITSVFLIYHEAIDIKAHEWILILITK